MTNGTINPVRDVLLSVVGTAGSVRNSAATLINSIGGNADMFLSNLAMSVPAVPPPPAPPTPPVIPAPTTDPVVTAAFPSFPMPQFNLPGFPSMTSAPVLASRSSPVAATGQQVVVPPGNHLATTVDPRVSRVRMR